MLVWEVTLNGCEEKREVCEFTSIHRFQQVITHTRKKSLKYGWKSKKKNYFM